MPSALTFLHSAFSTPACEGALLGAHTARQQGFFSRVFPIPVFSAGEILAGGTLFFVLGTPDQATAHETENDAIPFWLYLNSLNPGSLRKLRFAVHVLDDNEHCYYRAFGNACNTLLGQLGGTCLHPFTTSVHAPAKKQAFDSWTQAVFAKLNPSQTLPQERLAA